MLRIDLEQFVVYFEFQMLTRFQTIQGHVIYSFFNKNKASPPALFPGFKDEYVLPATSETSPGSPTIILTEGLPLNFPIFQAILN